MPANIFRRSPKPPPTASWAACGSPSAPKADAVEQWVDMRLASQKPDEGLTFVVRSLDGTLIGSSSYLNVDAANRRLEIGNTWYVASARRSGVNSETKLLMLGHAFDELGCVAVEFRTHFFNFTSRAAIERLGAKLDGVLRSHQVLPDGSRRDTVVYSILDIEWPAVRNNLRYRLASRHARANRALEPVVAILRPRVARGSARMTALMRRMPPATADLLAGVRRLCLALPEVTEGLTHGGETWFVRRRSFAKFVDPEKHRRSASDDSRLGMRLRSSSPNETRLAEGRRNPHGCLDRQVCAEVPGRCGSIGTAELPDQ